jgi:hypothetical protein
MLSKECGSMLAKDLKDFLCAFNTHKVEYLVVGSYAVGVYSQPRATKDLDVLIRVSEENGKAVFRALADFGASLEGISPSDFSDDPSSAFQIGQVTPCLSARGCRARGFSAGHHG